jgi:hypothetical protein
MPDGSQWDVPAAVVAHRRATYYANKDTGETSGRLYTTIYLHELDYTLRNNGELLEWGANNMNWSEVQASANMHKAGNVDYQKGWVNGKKSVVEMPNDPGESTPASQSH